MLSWKLDVTLVTGGLTFDCITVVRFADSLLTIFLLAGHWPAH